ncbi:MAG: PKD domain-containing protein [Acidobacteriota bacterium]
MVNQTRRSLGLLISAVALLVVGLIVGADARPAEAQCLANTGAKGPPPSLWGALEPADVDSVPDERDTTEYVGGNQTTDWRHPLFSSVDIEQGYAFTSYAFGLHVWDVGAGGASGVENPQLLATRDQGREEFLENIGYQEQRWLMWDIDAPAGDSNVVAVAGIAPFGISIWDTSEKLTPKIVYQDTGRTARAVYATTIGDNHYAFLASSGEGTPQKGLLVYDLSAAVALTGSCLEDSSAGAQCGVYRGRLGSAETFQYVDGVKTAGGRTILAASAGYDPTGYTPGIALWDVTNPNAPNDLLNGGRLFPDERVEGVAVWEQGGRQYLALQSATFGGARIHDISGCLGGSCSNPPEVWSTRWPISIRAFAKFATYSKGSDGTGYLYFGTLDSCIEEVQGEWLYSLADLTGSGPNEVTPDQTIMLDGQEVGYWSHYYGSRSSGFNRITPRVGKVNGSTFYRAAWTLFDVHKLQSLDPAITVIADPEQAYAGDEVKLTAQAAACTPDPAQWSWSADGGTIDSAKTEVGQSSSTVYVTWDTPGAKNVSVTNIGCVGAEGTAGVQIVNPAPVVGNVTATPSTAPQCTPITLEADATGQPTLQYAWEVDTDPVTSGAGQVYVWDTSGVAVTTETTFTATVTVTNSAGADQGMASVTINPLDSLPLPGFTSLSNDPATSASVRFHVDEPGATAWNWDFGNGYTGWVDNPETGPNPLHVYTQDEVDAVCGGNLPCTFDVRVKVRNCLSDPAGVESAALPVEILELTPLHAEFEAEAPPCQVAPCVLSYTVNEPIEFVDMSTGAELYDYDWDGDGQFEDAGNTAPVTSHTYSSTGTYAPRLRVRRGTSESDTYVHPQFTVDPAVPASIGVSGPTSGSVGQSLRYVASATNCSAAPDGWTWTATGQTVADTDAVINVAFPTSGTKTITARNSSCGSAQGNLLVSVTSSGGGNPPPPPPPPPTDDGLDAAFTVDPASPDVGEEVTFDGSSSSGSNLAFFWEFGDGSTGTQEMVTHVFEEPGTYQVTLSISDRTCLSAGCPVDTATRSVNVEGGVQATFDTSATCVREFGFNQCNVQTGEQISLTGTTPGADSHEWDFGDGETGTGRQVTHRWLEPGPYTVRYTATKDGETGTATQLFVAQGDPVGDASTVVLPWIAQADPDKILQQESDLYVHNPGPGPLTLGITFRKQGLPEPDPPHVTETLQEKQTLYLADVMTELFDRPNIKGFLIVEPEDGEAQPVVTSFNRTFQEDRTYGQVIPGFPLDSGALSRQGGADRLHLVGLNDNEERLAYFGITNPTDAPLQYNLRFFDALGRTISATNEPFTVARFGQKQFQVEEIHRLFGVEAVDDYRVAIEPVEPVQPPIPFGANLRLGSKDPSFLRVGRTDASEVFILGALDSMGLNESVFQTDLILANTAGEPVNVEVTFTGAGVFTEPTMPLQLTLPPGDTTRRTDVISEWDDVAPVGVLRLSSDGAPELHPVVQGESYEISNPAEIYGQFMPALTVDDAAVPGKPVSLVGLRQDEDFVTGTRSTVWLYNPGDEAATYTLQYLDHDGDELGTDEARLGAGKFRQVNPGFHPLPAEGAPEGFVVRVEVSSGAILVAGQVVNEFNDPAYIVGR